MDTSLVARHRWTILIALVSLLILPLAALMVAGTAPSAIEEQSAGVQYPHNYRTTFALYATVQRPDGTIRDLYINAIGLEAVRARRVLPAKTVIVIEAYNALKQADGTYVTDAGGRYVKGEPLPSLHVREKRTDWKAADFTSGSRSGGWNFGSFDSTSGASYDESLNICFLCHNTAPRDFIYSYPQLESFAQTGIPAYFFCPTTGRTACE